jgi:Probable N6-adenine methyltransferase
LSQFWYDDETQQAMARELLQHAGAEGTIAIISAPSVMNGMMVSKLFAAPFIICNNRVCAHTDLKY